ncbi:GNAT family N-acetyltransferase [Streptomyces corynorhini]|uniref:GNAT family N-acetyltransferase n=1 Tax=Streptomyces corynorhini TaxID=2282652 RepID=A0A370B9I6_9ACTN|nr:GNAT family N-acetyltransferase [Streptomyces corynorhini]RDG36814.1 GNAT family N-acetyltransferase [Streptomyces corynorhini]
MLITLGNSPSAAETAAWHAVVVAAHDLDLPASVPEPSITETVGKLRVPSTGGRSVHMATTAPDGSYTGVASLMLFTEPANRHRAFLNALVVRPDARRHGVGAALWAAVRDELSSAGRGSVATVLEVGGAGEAFVDSLGFTNVLPLGWYVQRVRRALEEIPPPSLPAGLRFADWTGVVPDAYAASFALAHEAMNDAPAGELAEGAERWDAERVRAAARVIEERGGVIHTSVVLDAARGDAVVAYTEVVLRDPADTRALQYDTVVVPDSRGHGLGRAVKRHLLDGLCELRPGVREITTTVADENTGMLAVNESLGYRRERAAGVFQLKL